MNRSLLSQALLASAVTLSCGFALYAVQTDHSVVQHREAAQVVEKEICVGDKKTSALTTYGSDRAENNIGPIAGYYEAYFSQSIYTSAQLDIAEGGTVSLLKIAYDVNKEYEVKKFPVEVYVGTTDKTEITTRSCVPLTDQTLVYSGDFNFPMGDSTIEVPFSSPYAFDSTQNLVVTIIKKNTQSTCAIKWQWFDTPNSQFVQGTDTAGLSGEDRYKSVPVIKLTYQAGGAASEYVDLAATAFDAPADMEAGVATPLKVKVANKGTSSVSAYKVEVLDVTDAASPLTLGSVDCTSTLEPQAETEVSVPVTLEQTGSRQLAARVVAEGDVNTGNDTTAPVSVSVARLSLQVASLTAPATAGVDTPVSFSAVIENKSNATIPASDYTLSLCNAADLSKVVAVPTVDLAPGQNTVSFSHAFTMGGDLRLVAVAKVSTEAQSAVSPELALNVNIERLPDVRVQHLNTWETWEETYNGTTTIMGNNCTCLIPGNGISAACGAQWIYDAKMLDMVRDGQIYSLSFYMKKYEYTSPSPMHLKVYLGTTELASFSELAALKDQTLVYEGDKIFDKPADGEEWKITLQRPFAYDHTKNLVLTVVATLPSSSPVMPVVRCNRAESSVELSSLYSADIFNAKPFPGNHLPILSMEYALNPLPQFIDASVGALSVSTPFDDTTKKAVFAATVSNLGTKDAESFTVEILDIKDGEAYVIGSRTYDRILAAEGTFNAKVTVEFAESGSYNLAARVVVDGDTNLDNNVSAETLPFEVTIKNDDSGVQAASAGRVTFADGALRLNGMASDVAVYDAAGRLIASADVRGAQSFRLDLAAGIYTVAVKGNDGRTSVLKIRK